MKSTAVKKSPRTAERVRVGHLISRPCRESMHCRGDGRDEEVERKRLEKDQTQERQEDSSI